MRTHALTTSFTTLLLLAIPIFAAPTQKTLLSRAFELPTCGAAICLTPEADFMGCPPADLGCLCSLPQELVSEYVALVQPCVDGAEGAKACTEGARSQYKDLLAAVCAWDEFGKVVEWGAPNEVKR